MSDDTTNAQRPEVELAAQPAVMTAQVQIIRAGTGKVEDYTLTFTGLPEEQQQPKEA